MRLDTALVLPALASAFVLPNFVLDEAQRIFSLSPDATSSTDALPLVDSKSLQDLVTLDALNASAIELFEIAQKSTAKYGHPTRVIGSPGHWATVGWILDQLEELSDYYTFYTQEFQALDSRIFNYSLTINNIDIANEEVTPLSNTPGVHAYYADVAIVNNFGCDDDDYSSLVNTTNSIALVKRGKCAFGDKSSLAGKNGARAVLVFDPETPGKMSGATLGSPTNTTIATAGITKELGENLVSIVEAGLKPKIDLFIDAYVGYITTKNVIAETIEGDKDNVVSLGAHSDSVGEGPGINDDGSGTISLLTVAKELTNFKVNNSVRFAWWAAEEEGLLGSSFYANNLTKEENQKIRLFMDYDMMASPNAEYEVYNGSNIVNPPGSEDLKQLYIDFYESKGLPWVLIPFDGRSDYVGFIENGIPGGGIAAGAEKKNVFNGEVLDKCYHQLCDDLTNLNWDAFLINTQLIAHSVATYASDLSDFPERQPIKAVEKDDTPLFAMRGDHYVI